jgi:hypothetical protein
MNEYGESKALSEVREWKAACARDVDGLEIGAAVRKRLRDSAETARKLGFLPADRKANAIARVAETGEAYGGERHESVKSNAQR